MEHSGSALYIVYERVAKELTWAVTQRKGGDTWISMDGYCKQGSSKPRGLRKMKKAYLRSSRKSNVTGAGNEVGKRDRSCQPFWATERTLGVLGVRRRREKHDFTF